MTSQRQMTRFWNVGGRALSGLLLQALPLHSLLPSPPFPFFSTGPPPPPLCACYTGYLSTKTVHCSKRKFIFEHHHSNRHLFYDQCPPCVDFMLHGCPLPLFSVPGIFICEAAEPNNVFISLMPSLNYFN